MLVFFPLMMLGPLSLLAPRLIRLFSLVSSGPLNGLRLLFFNSRRTQSFLENYAIMKV